MSVSPVNASWIPAGPQDGRLQTPGGRGGGFSVPHFGPPLPFTSVRGVEGSSLNLQHRPYRDLGILVVSTLGGPHAIKESLAVSKQLGIPCMVACDTEQQMRNIQAFARRHRYDHCIAVNLERFIRAMATNEVLRAHRHIPKHLYLPTKERLGAKQNFRALLQHVYGTNVFALDDDVRALFTTAADGSRLLNEFDIVAFQVLSSPDNSSIHLIARMSGLPIQTSIGGGAMLLGQRAAYGLTPLGIYNEDLFARAEDWFRGSIATYGEATQAPNDPLDPRKAGSEELGELGLLVLLKIQQLYEARRESFATPRAALELMAEPDLWHEAREERGSACKTLEARWERHFADDLSPSITTSVMSCLAASREVRDSIDIPTMCRWAGDHLQDADAWPDHVRSHEQAGSIEDAVRIIAAKAGCDIAISTSADETTFAASRPRSSRMLANASANSVRTTTKRLASFNAAQDSMAEFLRHRQRTDAVNAIHEAWRTALLRQGLSVSDEEAAEGRGFIDDAIREQGDSLFEAQRDVPRLQLFEKTELWRTHLYDIDALTPHDQVRERWLGEQLSFIDEHLEPDAAQDVKRLVMLSHVSTATRSAVEEMIQTLCQPAHDLSRSDTGPRSSVTAFVEEALRDFRSTPDRSSLDLLERLLRQEAVPGISLLNAATQFADSGRALIDSLEFEFDFDSDTAARLASVLVGLSDMGGSLGAACVEAVNRHRAGEPVTELLADVKPLLGDAPRAHVHPRPPEQWSESPQPDGSANYIHARFGKLEVPKEVIARRDRQRHERKQAEHRRKKIDRVEGLLGRPLGEERRQEIVAGFSQIPYPSDRELGDIKQLEVTAGQFVLEAALSALPNRPMVSIDDNTDDWPQAIVLLLDIQSDYRLPPRQRSWERALAGFDSRATYFIEPFAQRDDELRALLEGLGGGSSSEQDRRTAEFAEELGLHLDKTEKARLKAILTILDAMDCIRRAVADHVQTVAADAGTDAPVMSILNEALGPASSLPRAEIVSQIHQLDRLLDTVVSPASRGSQHYEHGLDRPLPLMKILATACNRADNEHRQNKGLRAEIVARACSGNAPDVVDVFAVGTSPAAGRLLPSTDASPVHGLRVSGFRQRFRPGKVERALNEAPLIPGRWFSQLNPDAVPDPTFVIVHSSGDDNDVRMTLNSIDPRECEAIFIVGGPCGEARKFVKDTRNAKLLRTFNVSPYDAFNAGLDHVRLTARAAGIHNWNHLRIGSGIRYDIDPALAEQGGVVRLHALALASDPNLAIVSGDAFSLPSSPGTIPYVYGDAFNNMGLVEATCATSEVGGFRPMYETHYGNVDTAALVYARGRSTGTIAGLNYVDEAPDHFLDCGLNRTYGTAASIERDRAVFDASWGQFGAQLTNELGSGMSASVSDRRLPPDIAAERRRQWLAGEIGVPRNPARLHIPREGGRLLERTSM